MIATTMAPHRLPLLFAPALLLVAACGAAPAPLPRAAGDASDAEGMDVAEDNEDGFFHLLTVPPAHHPAEAPVPVPEELVENPPTSGTCVGEPPKAAPKRAPTAICCYTSPSVFQKHVRAKWDAMKACYDDALDRNPKTHGRVVSKFTIASDGRVPQACDAGSTVADPKLVECVLRAMTTVTFPASPDDDPCPPITILYPIQFSPTPAAP